jgi:hypothetical protein
MRTVGDLLRAADPLKHEGTWSPLERVDTRQNVLTGSRVAVSEWSRRSLVVAIATVCLTAGAGIALPRFFSPPLQAAVSFEIRLAEVSPAPELEPVTVSQSGLAIYLHPDVIVTNEDIAEAKVVPGNSASTFGVEVIFDAIGTEKMLHATSGHLGNPIAMLINGEVVAAPTLRSRISKSAVMDGELSQSEAARIADGMIGR